METSLELGEKNGLVAEQVDAADLESVTRKGVRVRLSPRPLCLKKLKVSYVLF